MKKSKVMALLLSAAMVLGLTACGGGDTQTSSGDADAKQVDSAEGSDAADSGESAEASSENTDGEKIVLNFYEHSDNEKIANQQVEEYMKLHPEVQINLSIIANDDYDDKIKVMLAGDADIDVLWARSGNIRQMGVDGALLKLNDLIDANEVDYSLYGPMGDTCKNGEDIYGMCAKKTCWLLWYNKDLFDAAGVDLPTDITWDGFADLCQELTTDELKGGLTVNWTYLIGAQTRGEYLTDDDLTYTRKYAEFLHRIWVEDESNYSLEEMSGSFDVNGVFAEGNTYMMINGDWNFLLFPDSNPEFEWGALPLPHFEDQEVNASMGSTDALCINAKSKNAEAAFDFIKFCTYSDEGAAILAQNATVSAYPSEGALDVYNQYVDVPGTEYVFSSVCSPEDGSHPNYSEIKDAYSAEVQEYLLDNCTYDECMENFLQRREEILAK